ncbi:aspartate-tRna ligase [Cardiosporidium cionae]|uniref:aspartate--tRNA ligase n=1 Tax=Cardiosporidium cionae TaxID=476202 RepID=A0ABQ7J7B2_9APIC|nr:aspartate-tRna ligase [Cardiosporidium cionae]|eukprot:KAF8819580.1 aspartate-tRna ligase [Cardiosporidium cionae]
MQERSPADLIVASSAVIGEEGTALSKKGKKKAEKRNAKAQRQQEVALAVQQAQNASVDMNKVATSFEDDTFGLWPLIQSSSFSSRQWVTLKNVNTSLIDQPIWIRARLQSSRRKGAICFVVLRHQLYTLQCVLDGNKNVSKDMLRWTAALPLESIVDIYGFVSKPDIEITATTQKVEICVEKFFCMSKATSELPFQLKDANTPDTAEGDEVIVVNQDTRLDNRILDLRTMANQSIFRLQSEIGRHFREFLREREFIEIHSPKLLGGASEGGSACFMLDYFNRKACLAQSPQLYKQMVLCGDMDRVFEVGPVFRAENSNTHRHLCEFVGLDLEMVFMEHYFEVLDLMDALFQYIFQQIITHSQNEIDIIHRQHPASPFVWIEKTPRLEFVQAVEFLREFGCEDIPEDPQQFDLSTEHEKLLGKIIKEKYGTDFYILIRFPLKWRPFYSMPCPDDPTFSNSYDFFMRGEEILSGAQRIHDSLFLTQRAMECGIPIDTVKAYLDSFSLGVCPHAGCGIGLERVLMLFLGLSNVRKTSLFPRDPKRLEP